MIVGQTFCFHIAEAPKFMVDAPNNGKPNCPIDVLQNQELKLYQHKTQKVTQLKPMMFF